MTHHVAGPGANPRVADRSKAGRQRAHDPDVQPRACTPAAPQSQTRQPGPCARREAPCTSKDPASDRRPVAEFGSIDEALDFQAYLRLAKRRGALSDLTRGEMLLTRFF